VREARNTPRWRHRRTGPAWAAAVAILGIVVSLAVARAVDATERANTRAAVNHRAAIAQQALSDEIQRYVDTMRLVANAAGTEPELTGDLYRQFTHPLHDLHLVGASGVTLVVPAQDDQVAATEARWRGRGVPGLTLKPDGTGHEHFFAIFTRQLDGSAGHAAGGDVAQAPEPAAALIESRRGGGATLSRPYHLIRDRRLPVGRQQLSFVLAVPVLGPMDERGQRPFRGWLAVALRGQDFTRAILRDSTQGLVNAKLYAPGSDGTQVQVAALNDRSGGGGELRRDITIHAVQQRWTLRADFQPVGTGNLALWVAVSGGLLALALAALVLVLLTARDRARAQVVRATERLSADIASRKGVEAALRETRDALGAQRAYLGALLDSIDVAVIACDTDGRVTVENAYSQKLRGTDERSRLTDLDGDPLTFEQMPLVRTLHEGTVDTEVLHHGADRRPLAMLAHGRTLYSADGDKVGAVVTAYDITALREHERELSGFAGIAAHDLKSPLAVISAYTEMLSEQAGGNDAELLRRIDNGVKRMRSLIDDLLAYSTARDAPLETVDVDLRQLVTDVVGARTDHLRLTAGEAFPDVYVGPLPDIHADRAMVRQLIDNLVGNALKYVRPGAAARVDVTASVRGDWAEIQVADRGIGIPAAERDVVFAPFHRLRTEHSYGGTGLGLAICQRIVDRHGGRIAVTENPGGGSRFTFTLPACQPPELSSSAPSGTWSASGSDSQPAGSTTRPGEFVRPRG
jgi:signal transduction histidine kinase